jgi:Zn-dependent alcohol dehydrogenase
VQITAAVATAPHSDFTIRALNLDAPGPHEVLVRIAGWACATPIWSSATSSSPSPARRAGP